MSNCPVKTLIMSALVKCTSVPKMVAQSPSTHNRAHGARGTRCVVKRSVKVMASSETPGIETTGPNMKALKEIQEIMDILPHRYGQVPRREFDILLYCIISIDRQMWYNIRRMGRNLFQVWRHGQ